MSYPNYLSVRWEVSKSEFFTKKNHKLIDYLVTCFLPSSTAEITCFLTGPIAAESILQQLSIVHYRTYCMSYSPLQETIKESQCTLGRLLGVHASVATCPQTVCPHPAQKEGMRKASHLAHTQISSTETCLCSSLCPHGGKEGVRDPRGGILEAAPKPAARSGLSVSSKLLLCTACSPRVLGPRTMVGTNWNSFLVLLCSLFFVLINKIMQKNLA